MTKSTDKSLINRLVKILACRVIEHGYETVKVI